MINVVFTPIGKRVYICGPMSGHALYNFPAFRAAEADLAARGWSPLSPAAMDIAEGFDPATMVADQAFMAHARRRDTDAILDRADALAMLPGWESSVGATAEYHLGKWKGIPCYRYPEMVPVGCEDVLDEAKRITSGDRQNAYGPPTQDFARTAAMWTALKGVDFTARDVALFMICLKLSRETHQRKRDNAVDICGYGRCLALCQDAEGGA